MKGLGSAISKVADRLRSQRETGEALQTLGQTEQIKRMYNPPEWKPTTKAEAMEFEKEKVGIKNQPEAIVDKAGNIIGYRPAGSVFQPSATIDEIIGQLGTDGGLPKIKANVPKVTTPSKTGKRIMVISPDGQRGDIPTEQLQEALQAGYKRTLK